MRVKLLQLRYFMSYTEALLKFPDTGVLMITGANGAGKSSIVEGVSFGGWGETLRGPSPWLSGVPLGSISFGSTDVNVTRKRTGARNDLQWFPRTDSELGAAADTVMKLGDGGGQFENATKAQEALERVIGSHDVWRRSHVFSSHDAAHFTLATDKERKVLLESVLGVDVFDEGLKACRDALKVAAQAHHDAKLRMEALTLRAAGARRRIEESVALLEQIPKTSASGSSEKVRRLAALLVEQKAALADLSKNVAAANSEAAERAGFIRALQRKLDSLQVDKCPTCGQGISERLREPVRKQIEEERAKAMGISSSIREQMEADQEQRESLDGELEELRKKKAELEAADANAATHAKQRALLASRVEESEAEVSRLLGELASLTVEEGDSKRALQELYVVEQVLGLRGVRAQILGNALAGLERIANNWLLRIAGPGLSLHLATVDDKIRLEVNGAGGGHGYQAASGGQRRRIDIALMFALAEVSSAARGLVPGTMFFDEVFDALDEEGVEAVAAALTDLARERCVVVISHNIGLVRRLPGAHQWHLPSPGKVEVLS